MVAEKLLEEVKEWDSFMKSLPTWEEIRDIEYVRQSGTINMFTGDVVGELTKLGLFSGINWLHRCKENKQFWGTIYSKTIESFEKDHDRREKWITDEFRERVEDTQIALEEILLRRKIQELKVKRNGRKTKAY